MPSFSPFSERNLASCHPDLQIILREVVKHIDCRVLCGHRNKQDQDEAYESGNSTVKWPNSKHNTLPSLAVDVVPYPIDWENLERFKELATYVFRAAMERGLQVEWGGHWQNFKDYPHWQIQPVIHADMGFDDEY